MSFHCVAASLICLRCVVDTTLWSKDLYQMLLHRPVDPACLIGNVGVLAIRGRFPNSGTTGLGTRLAPVVEGGAWREQDQDEGSVTFVPKIN